MTQRDGASRDGSETTRRRPDIRAVFLAAVAVLFVVLLIVRGIQPEASEATPAAPEVQVRRPTVADVQTTVEASGTVRPKTEMGIVPEVSGRVVFVHSELTSGGIIRANETILQIDARQYEVDVRRARAAVDEAQVKLDTELTRARLTEGQPRGDYRESEPDLSAALAQLQVRQARAALEWAQAELAMAELKLERTSISLPFDVSVMTENVDLGQHVAAGEELAAVCGIDAFEIQLAIDGNDVSKLDVFDRAGASTDDVMGDSPAPVDVWAHFGHSRYSWDGFVSRIAGQIDPVTQKVPLVVDVPRPLEAVGDKPSLLPGISVEVLLAGPILSNAVAVPRQAVHDGHAVWLVEDGRLHMVELDVAWSDEQFVYVTSGLSSEDAIVTSPLEAPVEGMAVHVTSDPTISD